MNLTGGFGGAEVYTERLLELLEHELTFYALVYEPELEERLKGKNVNLLPLPFRRFTPKLLRMLLGLPLLVWVVLRHRIDIVHINGYSEAIYLPVARALGCTAVATRHLTFDIEQCRLSRYIQRRLARSIYCICAPSANRIVAVSESVGTGIRTLIPAASVEVIPNWLPTVPPSRCERSLLHSPARLLYVGRLTQLKGLHLVLAAIKDLPHVHLTVVGEGPLRAELEQMSRGIDVEFVGFKPDPIPFYAEADIFINPSHGPEGSPLVILDAMASYVPCILSDLPIFQEMSDNGKAALLFRTGNSNDLRAKLLTFLQDDLLREQSATAAYGLIMTRHTKDTVRTRYMNALGIGRIQ